nr:hypothetical protein GCM10020092_073300 [Actinoplanes digitatis]
MVNGVDVHQVVSRPVTFAVYGSTYTVWTSSDSALSSGEVKSTWVVASLSPTRTAVSVPSGCAARAAVICWATGRAASPGSATTSSSL